MLQRYYLRALLLLAVLIGIVSCASDRRTAPPAEKSNLPTPTTADLSKGWSLNFCSDQTVDDNVSVEIGRADDEASHRVWRAFNPRTDPALVLPDDLRYVDHLWIKLTSENHREVEACLKYDGNAAKKILFNETSEQSVDRTNQEDCGC